MESMKQLWEDPEYGIKIFSIETRKKMSDAKRGKILSPEHRAKIGEAGKGRINPPISDETRFW